MIWDCEEKVEGAKDCPFCGSNKIKAMKKDNDSRTFRCVHIKCDVCMAQVPGFGDGYDKAFEEALAIWNGRATA